MTRDTLIAPFLQRPIGTLSYELVTLGRKLSIGTYRSDRVHVVGDRLEARGTIWIVNHVEPPARPSGHPRLICLELEPPP